MDIINIYNELNNYIRNETQKILLCPNKYSKLFKGDERNNIFLKVIEKGNNFEIILYIGNNTDKIRNEYYINYNYDIISLISIRTGKFKKLKYE